MAFGVVIPLKTARIHQPLVFILITSSFASWPFISMQINCKDTGKINLLPETVHQKASSGL